MDEFISDVFFYWSLNIDVPLLTDKQELIYICSVKRLDENLEVQTGAIDDWDGWR